MGTINGIKYSQQLLMPEWKSKRKEILFRDSYKCKGCGSNAFLQVHHKKYIKGKFAWEVPNEFLVTLCKTCHKEVHGIGKGKKKSKKAKKFTIKSNIKNKQKKKVPVLSDRDKKLQERYNKLKKQRLSDTS